MGTEMDSLEIGIQVSAQQANKALDSLVSKLRQISTQLGISSISMGHFSGAVNNLTAAMTGFKNSGVKGSDFTRIVTGLNKLSTIDSGAINRASGAISSMSRQLTGMGSLNFDSEGLLNIARSISKFGSKTAGNATANLPKIRQDLIGFVQGLNGIGSINFDMTGLSNLVASISKLGGKAATNSIPNIQALGMALKQLIVTLSTAPHLSQNVIQLTNALANLASKGSKVSSAGKAMQNSLKGYSASAKTATKSSKSLVSAIGMFYAKCFLAIRGVKALWRAIKSSMDYIETLNYFDAAWRQVSGKAAGQWKQAGYDSAEAYADSFSKRAKELTGKMTGFQPDKNGNLISTGEPSLGLDPNMLMNYQATFGQMASSMGVTSENALKLSNALTMIGADLASVKNLKFEDVWRDMSSGMVGMSRTLDKYGVNIRNVNMQEKLNELGIKAKITALNQQDKVLLRTIILLNATQYAWGDMARTIEQPANQLRLLQANFANLARTIGNIFLPIVSKILPYINALVIALQRLFSWIGSLLGIKIGSFSSSIGSAAADMGDFADEAGDAAGSLNDAAGSAKKLKGNLAGWDEIENRTTNDKNAGGGAGGGGGIASGLLDDAFNAALAEYQAAWDKAFSNMENSAQQMADRIVNVFKQIWDIADVTRAAIERLWNQGLSKLATFTWGTLQDFWNNFLNPIGQWMLSDNSGLPRLFNITNDLLNEINWERLKTSLGDFYTSLSNLSKFVWTALMDFYEHFLKPLSVWTMSKAIPQLVDAFTRFNNKIDWKGLNKSLDNLWKVLAPFAQKVGQGLVDFIDDFVNAAAPFINTIGKGFIGILSKIIKWLTPFADELGYLIGLNLGLSALSGTFKFLSQNLKLIAKVITGSTLTKAFSTLTRNIPKVIEGFQLLSGGAGTLREVIAFEFPKIGRVFGSLMKITSPFHTFASKLVESYSLISGGAGTMREVLAFEFPKVAGLIGKVVEGFGLLTSGAGTLKEVVSLEFPGITSSFSSMFRSLGALPYLLIAGGIAAIVFQIMRVTDEAAKNSAIGQFSQAISDLNEKISTKTGQIKTSLENTQTAIETAGVGETQVARDLADEYEKLSSKAGLSADEKQRLKDISQDLIDIIPDLSKYIDDETGYLDIQKSSLDELITGYDSLAQKQAAQEYLVQAYKDQYEAQMNVNNAINGYNKAYEDYLKNAGIAPDIINQLANGTFDLTDLQEAGSFYANNSEVAFKEKYGVDNPTILKKAYDGLNESIEDYQKNLSDAYEIQDQANANLETMKTIISDNDEKQKASTQTLIAETIATDKYKQSLSDLQTTFSGLDINLADSFMQELTLNDFDTEQIEKFFSSLTEGVQASSSDLKEIFKNLGLSLPTDLAKALSQKEPAAQAAAVKILMSIQSGVQAKESDLNTLFQNMGIELPDSLVQNLASKEPTVQTSAIDLLSKIESGYSLKEGSLKTLFSELGIQVSDELVKSLESKEPDIQSKTIALLGQITGASDSERDAIIKNLKDLGIDGADSLGKGIDSEQGNVTTSAKNLASSTKSAISDELNPSDTSSGSIYDAGANASKGFWQGLKDNWDDSWLGKKINSLKEMITGKQGLDEHSPSKILGKYGAYAGIGFNNDFEAEMDKTVPLIETWLGNIRATFGGYELATPNVDLNFSRINADPFGYQHGIPKKYTSDFADEMQQSIYMALSDALDYNRLADSIYEANSKALQENPVKIGDDEIFQSTQRGQQKFYTRTKKTGITGID